MSSSSTWTRSRSSATCPTRPAWAGSLWLTISTAGSPPMATKTRSAYSSSAALKRAGEMARHRQAPESDRIRAGHSEGFQFQFDRTQRHGIRRAQRGGARHHRSGRPYGILCAGRQGDDLRLAARQSDSRRDRRARDEGRRHVSARAPCSAGGHGDGSAHATHLCRVPQQVVLGARRGQRQDSGYVPDRRTQRRGEVRSRPEARVRFQRRRHGRRAARRSGGQVRAGRNRAHRIRRANHGRRSYDRSAVRPLRGTSLRLHYRPQPTPTRAGRWSRGRFAFSSSSVSGKRAPAGRTGARSGRRAARARRACLAR